MKILKLERILKLVAFGGLLLTLMGGASSSLSSSPLLPASRNQLSLDQSMNIHLRRLDIVDSPKPHAQAWAVSGQDWVVYNSLYSRHLRELLSHQKTGATVWLDMNPAANAVIGQPDPDATEVKAFSAFCAAHGLRFFVSPIT